MSENTNKYYIYGKNPILEVLLSSPKRVNKIYIQKGISYDNRIKKILDIASLNKVPVVHTNLQKFKCEFEPETNLQGIIAHTASIEYMDLDDFLENKKDDFKRIVILDGITDPHNFGAIIRTAAAAGLDAIMISNHRSCLVTPVVEKISVGAINHISIIKTSSLSASIDKLKDNDFWVIATQMQAKDNYYDINYTDMNFALIMGSEGSGISKTILNKADFTVKIESQFESLNVSNATAVIIYEAIRQISLKRKNS